MIKRLGHIEHELTRGGKDPQIQQLIVGCKNESSMILEQLDQLRKDPEAELNTIRRQLFATAVTWNSTVHEQMYKIGKEKRKHVRSEIGPMPINPAINALKSSVDDTVPSPLSTTPEADILAHCTAG